MSIYNEDGEEIIANCVFMKQGRKPTYKLMCVGDDKGVKQWLQYQETFLIDVMQDREEKLAELTREFVDLTNQIDDIQVVLHATIEKKEETNEHLIWEQKALMKKRDLRGGFMDKISEELNDEVFRLRAVQDTLEEKGYESLRGK